MGACCSCAVPGAATLTASWGFLPATSTRGETPTASIIREVREELGLELIPAALTAAGVMFRRSLEPRVDIFFAVGAWTGTPRYANRECTELVWASPDRLPVNALDYVSQALTNAREGFRFANSARRPAGRAE